LQRFEKVVATSLPDIRIVPAEPYERMDPEAVFPSSLDDIIADRMSETEFGSGAPLNNLLVVGPITSTIQADITPFESFPNISEL